MRATQETDETSLPARVLVWGRAYLYWPWLLVLGGWAVVVLATLTDHHQLVDHHYLLEHSHLPWMTALGVFLASWLVMTLAMMLPSSLPILHGVTQTAGEWPRAAEAVFLAGYVLVWAGFAAVAFAGDTLVHWLVDSGTWLSTHTVVIGAVTFALAGAFQFSPLKRLSLRACHHPLGSPADDGRFGARAAWRLGLRHGACCLGSGWALMLVMFGVGLGGVAWMAVLAGVMVIEKVVPGGQRLTPIVGGALLLLAAVWLLQPAWLPTDEM